VAAPPERLITAPADAPALIAHLSAGRGHQPGGAAILAMTLRDGFALPMRSSNTS